MSWQPQEYLFFIIIFFEWKNIYMLVSNYVTQKQALLKIKNGLCQSKKKKKLMNKNITTV